MVKRISKVVENKKQKKNAIFKSSYELFTTKGFNNTAISDIVKKAGVAKGTFYLYFKDKHDILDKIILRKSSIVIKEAYNATMEKDFVNFIDSILFFTDYIIEFLKKDKLLLKIIHKNLSWGLYRKALADSEHHRDMEEISESFINGLKDNKLYTDDVDKTLFIIIELIGSVCYSSIILQEPSSMDEMKPILFKMIRKIIEN